MQFKVGRPAGLTPEIRQNIIEAVPKGLRPQTIAHLARVHPNNLKRWLKQGENDYENSVNSEYAQLWSDFNHTKALKIVQWLGDMESRLQNWQALWELIRSVAREDFGVEAVEYKELLDLYTKLSEAFKRFTENPLQQTQGAITNAGEMDSKGDSQE